MLIVVSVALDMVQRIEANLLMRNYGGFLSGPGRRASGSRDGSTEEGQGAGFRVQNETKSFLILHH